MATPVQLQKGPLVPGKGEESLRVRVCVHAPAQGAGPASVARLATRSQPEHLAVGQCSLKGPGAMKDLLARPAAPQSPSGALG